MNTTSQQAIPLAPISIRELERCASFARAMEVCAAAAGYDLDKQASSVTGMDKARWSRVKAGTEGIKWDQLQAYMDACGNDAPLLWMLSQRGYDLNSVRKRETETEKALRVALEALERERAERAAVEQTMRRLLTGAPA